MHENRGCYSEEQLNGCDFMKQSEEITLDSILSSKIKLKDKYWFVCKKLLSKEQNKQLAIGVAEIVLEIYEKKYPDNKAPRQAIQAAKDYLAGTINIDELRSKRAAAYDAAADAAADAYAAAADAAYDAAYAAYAAAYAAAADAAYDAAYAAYAAAAYAAADAAYAAAKFQTALLVFLKELCKNNLPEYF